MIPIFINNATVEMRLFMIVMNQRAIDLMRSYQYEEAANLLNITFSALCWNGCQQTPEQTPTSCSTDPQRLQEQVAQRKHQLEVCSTLIKLIDDRVQQQQQQQYCCHDNTNHDRLRHDEQRQQPQLPTNPTFDESKSHFLMYTNAMEVVPYLDSRLLRGWTEEDLLDLVTCALLYNLGLCLHVVGIMQGKETQLGQALVTYELALKLLASSRWQDQHQQHYHPPHVLLELALLNNCGHIHCHFYDLQQFEFCLFRMQMKLSQATNQWKDHIPTPLNCFGMNLIHNSKQLERPSPAA